jgi:hypothetical protein
LQDLQSNRLDHKSLNLILQGSDLVHKITSFVSRNAGSNNRAGDTASTSKGTV